MARGVRLTHKLLGYWLGSVILLLAFIGGLAYHQISSLNTQDAQRELLHGFDLLRGQLTTTATQLRRATRSMAQREEVIASMSMIVSYQDPSDYRPLIFDVE